jgi:cullin-associated NEDD8-dissociated protein 1
LSANTDIFNRILGYFSDASGTLRDAAAFAAGNMAVGSPKFLQPIVQRVETATDQNDRLLSLHALREVRPASRSACTSSR